MDLDFVEISVSFISLSFCDILVIHFCVMAVLTNPNSMQENQNSSSQKRGTFYHPASGLKTPEDFILQKKETNIPWR